MLKLFPPLCKITLQLKPKDLAFAVEPFPLRIVIKPEPAFPP